MSWDGKPKKDTADNENYWKLIGTKGRVIDDEEINNRVIVLFEGNLDDYKLENHNPTKDSLWIKMGGGRY